MHREKVTVEGGGHLKKDTEVMQRLAQEQALQVNLIKHHTYGQEVSPMCRLCGRSSEIVIHLSSV